MSKILVTGGLGYIGSHTVVALQEKGYNVVIVDNLANSHIEILDRITKISGIKPIFEQIDLRDKISVSQLFEKYKDIEGIIHFAAFKAVGESVAKPLDYYENNLNTLIYLMQKVVEKQMAFIFSSSCTVYGEAKQMPIFEDAPVQPAISPYGNTKQIGEEIVLDVAKSTTIKAILLRYFNPIGAHKSGLIGELPNGVPQNLVPFITQTAIGKREKLSVYGNDYPTPDGTCIRDYIHVVDLAEAHVVSLERLLNNKNEKAVEIFNLGTGKGSSVLEVIKSFENVTNQKLNYQIVDRREGDVIQAYADTSKAREVLGWQTRFSLDEALKSSWEWELAYNNS